MQKQPRIVAGHIIQVMTWKDYHDAGEYTSKYQVWLQLQNYPVEFLEQNYIEKYTEKCWWFELEYMKVMEIYPSRATETHLTLIKV